MRRPFADRRFWAKAFSPTVLPIALVTGLGSAFVCVLLRLLLRFLQWAITGHSGLLADAAASLPEWRRFVTPIVGALLAMCVVLLARKLRPQEKFVEYVEAVRCHFGHIAFFPAASSIAASAFSIASGATIGREGSMIQFAASVVSALGNRLKLRSVSLERLVALGVAGAVAAVYRAPFAGAFFALEIVIGTLVFSSTTLAELPALLVAAFAGTYVSRTILGGNHLFEIKTPLSFNWPDVVPALVLALALGATGSLYVHTLRLARVLRSLPWPFLWSGAVVGALSCLQPDVWGNGDSGVLGVVSGSFATSFALTILLLRLGATSACVGSGVIGGVFTPTVFTGSVLGYLFASGLRFLPLHAANDVSYAVLGMACLLASVTHAPMMAAFMTVELTGTGEWFGVVLACSVISWLVSRRISPHSLYAAATPDPATPIREMGPAPGT